MPIINPHEADFYEETPEAHEWKERYVSIALPASLMFLAFPFALYFALLETGFQSGAFVLGAPLLIAGICYLPDVFFRRTIRLEKEKREVTVDTFSIFAGKSKETFALTDEMIELKRRFYFMPYGTGGFFHTVSFCTPRYSVVLERFRRKVDALEALDHLAEKLKLQPVDAANASNAGGVNLNQSARIR